MFESQDYRDALERQISIAVNEYRLLGYDNPVVDVLQFLAMSNEDIIRQTERGFLNAEQNGYPRSVESASLLSHTAARIALGRKSLTLQVQDIAHAYSTHYCRVWPFCRGR